MICDKITYGGQTLLTIYHQGFDDEIGTRSLKTIKEIGSYNLVFTEKKVKDDIVDNITDWSVKEEGFLTPSASLNPYTNDACAYMTHFRFASKPSRLFKFCKNRYHLNITIDNLMEINKFIKKYTGLSIEKNPMLYGDIFVFKNQILDYHTNELDEIMVKDLPKGATAIVKFKKSDIIVSTKITKTASNAEEIVIKSDKPWEHFDIEMYENDELLYLKKDVTYIRHIQMNLQMSGIGKRVKLNKIGDSYTIEKNNNIISNIGNPLDSFEEMMNSSTSEILKYLNAAKPNNQIVFIRPGELEKAIDLIGNVMQKANDVIWVFDSYFTDINDIRGMIDWIRILTNCKAPSKNLVFFCKSSDKALDLEGLKKEIRKDSVLNTIIRTRKTLGIHLYQTRMPIHDRFILTESDNINSGLAMGTSFNSLGNHHYCIYKLGHSTTQTIWNELESWMRSKNNLVKDGEV